MTSFWNYLKGFSILHYTIVLVSVIFISVFFKNCVTKKGLREKGVIVNVKIIELLPAGKAGVPCSYVCQFNYKGEILNLTSISSIRNKKNSFVGRYFPAIYLEGSNAIRILMKPDDFEDFGIAYPDSLINRVIDIAQ